MRKKADRWQRLEKDLHADIRARYADEAQWCAAHPGEHYVSQFPSEAARVRPGSEWDASIVNAGNSSSSVVVMQSPHFESGEVAESIFTDMPRANRSYRDMPSASTKGFGLSFVVGLNGDDFVEEPDTWWLPRLGESCQVSPNDSSNLYQLTTTSDAIFDDIGSRVTELTVRRRQPGYPPAPDKHIQHMSFINWPDLGVPSAKNGEMLDSLVARIADLREEYPGATTYVNCHMGRGRSGTFACKLFQLESQRAGRHLSDFEAVRQCREGRSRLVMTASQFGLLDD